MKKLLTLFNRFVETGDTDGNEFTAQGYDADGALFGDVMTAQR